MNTNKGDAQLQIKNEVQIQCIEWRMKTGDGFSYKDKPRLDTVQQVYWLRLSTLWRIIPKQRYSCSTHAPSRQTRRLPTGTRTDRSSITSATLSWSIRNKTYPRSNNRPSIHPSSGTNGTWNPCILVPFTTSDWATCIPVYALKLWVEVDARWLDK